MIQSVAVILTVAGGQITGFGFSLILLFLGACLLVGICWQLIDNWYARVHGRDWPAVSAVIDIVSVAFMEDDSIIPPLKAGSYNPYYQATLTYIYHYPEKQMGDYSRSFGKKEDAEAWANSYKGETVKVHVDPRDPTRSLLREEDL